MREGLLPILDTLEDAQMPWLLLEPTAGQGRSLCAGIEDLEPYLAALDHHPKAGVCLDTCHAFAAGAPLDEPAARPGPSTGWSRSPVPAGSGWCTPTTRWTRAARCATGTNDWAQGHIGTGAIAELLEHPATDGVPFILETPGSRDPGSDQIALVKELRA